MTPQTLAQLAAKVGGTIGLTDSATLTKVKAYATRRYELIAADALWKDLLGIYTKAVTAGQTETILPPHITDVVECKIDTEGLVPVDQLFLFRSAPDLWENLGTPTHWSELAPIATKVQPAGANGEPLRFVSSSGADTSQVRLYGEDANGEPLTETVTLTGAVNVSTVASFKTVLALSKTTTTGTITVAGNSSGTTLLTLGPSDTQKLHRRIRLHTLPGQDVTLLVLAKRAPAPFTHDNDTPQLSAKCQLALEAFTLADSLRMTRQYAKAETVNGEAIALMKDAQRDETYQAAQSRRLMPAESLAEGCSPYDFE